jgi:CBS domain-containing protein
MTCGEIMTRSVVCCVPEDTIERAAALMKTEDVGPIPVIESYASRKLVGMATDRDLIVKGIAGGRDAKSTEIRDIMADHPIACFEKDDVKEAIDLMADYQVRRIPVVGENNHLLGIIARTDVDGRAGARNKRGGGTRTLLE